MAKRLDNFDFGSSGNSYDWNRWADGTIWELTKGEDFQSKPQTAAQQARKWAKAQGMRVRVSAEKDGTKVILQFIRKDAEPQQPERTETTKKGRTRKG